jgi:hypothetical protein
VRVPRNAAALERFDLVALVVRFVQSDAIARHCEAPLGAEAIQNPHRGLWICGAKSAARDDEFSLHYT